MPNDVSDEILFYEEHASAQSLKSTWTRLASTYGCIEVTLTKQRLIIKAHWYAKWLINLLALDQCHEVPLSRIRDIKVKGKWHAGIGIVDVHFTTPEGDDRILSLYLRKHTKFADAAKALLSEHSA